VADAGVVIVRGQSERWLCARVDRLERGGSPEPEPRRGEELSELLPFEIVLGKTQASLSQLQGLGRKSLIALGLTLGQSEDAELRVAGMRLGYGKVVVVGEYLGLRLTRLEARVSQGGEFRQSGGLLAKSSAERVKDYDFERPDCFTWTQLKNLECLHKDFLAAFSALGGLDLSGAKITVDQLNFTEFVDSLDQGSAVVVAPCFRPGPSGVALSSAAPSSAAPQDAVPSSAALSNAQAPAVKALLRLGSSPNFPEEDIRAWVLHELCKGQGGAVLAQGPLALSHKDALFKALREAWKAYGGLAAYPEEEILKRGARPALGFGKYADEYEMVALASIDLGANTDAGQRGWLNLAYPLRAIEPLLEALSL
jgi:hypothetical protein